MLLKENGVHPILNSFAMLVPDAHRFLFIIILVTVAVSQQCDQGGLVGAGVALGSSGEDTSLVIGVNSNSIGEPTPTQNSQYRISNPNANTTDQ